MNLFIVGMAGYSGGAAEANPHMGWAAFFLFVGMGLIAGAEFLLRRNCPEPGEMPGSSF